MREVWKAPQSSDPILMSSNGWNYNMMIRSEPFDFDRTDDEFFLIFEK